MIDNLPDYVNIIFVLTVVATLVLLYYSVTKSTINHPISKAKFIILFIILWLIVQAVLTENGFYLNTTSHPPKFIFAVLPPILIIVALFITAEGKIFMDGMSLKYLTYLNTVRIPVELVLYWLFLNKAIPQLMTFEGRNFDIAAGITAPFVAFFGLRKQSRTYRIGRKFILAWNCICLTLLLNIMIIALFSVPFPFQKFAFDQPNIAVLYFPFSWLPSFIVPTVLFGHLVSIRQLIKRSK